MGGWRIRAVLAALSAVIAGLCVAAAVTGCGRGAATTSAVSSSTTLAPTTTSTNTTLAFDAPRATAHIKKLAVSIGIRHAGTDAEMAAVEYGRGYLGGMGYRVEVADVPIPNGLTSHNVIAVKQGTSSQTIVLGAQMDSWGPAPGAK